MADKKTLALTMIVKNEEANIGKVLDSARRFADQIVVIDTGSTDRTKEICQRYTDEVYDFTWCDDFALARNEGIRRCTADFIIWLDADDEISDEVAKNIVKLMKGELGSLADWDVLSLPYVYARNDSGEATIIQTRERIFRNSSGIFFHYPIHECLKIPASARLRERDDIVVVHQKAEGVAASHERNLRILSKAVETDEYRNHPRIWRMLASEESPEKSLPYYKKLFDEFSAHFDKPTLSDLYVSCAKKMIQVKRYDEAQEMLAKAIVAFPRWREPYFHLGRAKWHLKKFADALTMFEIAESMAAPAKEVKRYDPSIYCGCWFLEWKFCTYQSLGMTANMKETVRQAMKIDPKNKFFMRVQKKYFPARE